MFLLDTNICIYIIKKKPPVVLKKLQTKKITEIAISAVTFAELQYGVEKSQRVEQNRWALHQFLAPLQILPFDMEAAISFGRIRARLEKEGKPLGPFDMMIAGHCLSIDATLVTNNEKEFARVAGLKIENWAQ